MEKIYNFIGKFVKNQDLKDFFYNQNYCVFCLKIHVFWYIINFYLLKNIFWIFLAFDILIISINKDNTIEWCLSYQKSFLEVQMNFSEFIDVIYIKGYFSSQADFLKELLKNSVQNTPVFSVFTKKLHFFAKIARIRLAETENRCYIIPERRPGPPLPDRAATKHNQINYWNIKNMIYNFI